VTASQLSAQNAGLQDEILQIPRLAGQHLLGKIGCDRRMRAGKIADETFRVFVVFQRQRRQPQRSGPAAADLVQRDDVVRVQSELAPVAQEAGGFFQREAQLRCVDFQQLLPCAQATDAQHRLYPRADRETLLRAEHFRELLDHRQRRRVLQMFEFIENQHERQWRRRDCLRQIEAFAACRRSAGIRCPGRARHLRKCLAQTIHQAIQVVVAGVQRQPCDRPAVGAKQVVQMAQQRGDAEAGRRLHQDQLRRAGLSYPLHHPLAHDEMRSGSRRPEFRRLRSGSQ